MNLGFRVKKHFAAPFVLHCVSVSSFECVSCKKITSAFFLRHYVKIVRLLLKLLMPFTFEGINIFKLTEINSLYVNNVF